MSTALILFAHGARDPEWANSIRRVQAAIRSQVPAIPVELAFLEFMSPGLAECAAQLILAGAAKIVVLPMFIARGGHLKREVPEMLLSLQASYPAVQFILGNAIGEHEIVVQAMADAALLVSGADLSPDCPTA
ncbi:MAG: CbiX/SirB N-terminal domain-containing protein [Azonexus sp.]